MEANPTETIAPTTTTITPTSLGTITLHVHFSANDAYNNNIANLQDLQPLYPITFGKKKYTIPSFQKKMAEYLNQKLADDQSQPQEVKLSYSSNEDAFDVAIKILLGLQGVEIFADNFLQTYLILQELGIKVDRKSYPSQNPKFYDELEVMLTTYLKSSITKDECLQLMSFALSKQREDLVALCHKLRGFKNLVLELIDSKEYKLTEDQFIYIMKQHNKVNAGSDGQITSEDCLSSEDLIQIIMKYPNMDEEKKMISISSSFTEIKNQYENKIKTLEAENKNIKEASDKTIQDLKAKCSQYEATLQNMQTETKRPPERMQSPKGQRENPKGGAAVADNTTDNSSVPTTLNLVYNPGLFGKKMVEIVKGLINQNKDKTKPLNIGFTGDHKDYYAFLKTPEGKKDTRKKVLYFKNNNDARLIEDQLEDTFIKTANLDLFAVFYSEGGKKPAWKENDIANTTLKIFPYTNVNGQYDFNAKSKEDLITNLKKYIL